MKLSVGCHKLVTSSRSQPVLLPCNKLVTTCDSLELVIEKMNEQFQIYESTSMLSKSSLKNLVQILQCMSKDKIQI